MSQEPVLQDDGWWWPADDIVARPAITGELAPALKAMLPHVPVWGCVVQAGANVGVYPAALAGRFGKVVCAEPDPANFACLTRNLESRDPLGRITVLHAAFGAEPGTCSPLVVHPHNCGAHRVNFGTGTIPVQTIDALGLDRCDLIWLDIEGAELPALEGAEATVARFWPTIAVEDKGLHRAFGIADGALDGWFAAHGYEHLAQSGNDKVFRRRP